MDTTFFYWNDNVSKKENDEEGLVEFERFPICEEEDEYYDLAEVDYEGWD